VTVRPSLSWPTGGHHFAVVTDDGVRLVGRAYGPKETETALVICHGFTGTHRNPSLVDLCRRLSDEFAVFSFDFRGHGESEGISTLGDREVLDVQAVVEEARNRGFRRVVSIGASMGGGAVLRAAALHGGVDAVVSISAPAEYKKPRKLSSKVMSWFIRSRPGRWVLHRQGTRVSTEWNSPQDPRELAAQIGEIPVTVVHGEKDRYLSTREAELIYWSLAGPRTLVILPEFGHAEAGFDAPFADLLARLVRKMLVPVPAPVGAL